MRQAIVSLLLALMTILSMEVAIAVEPEALRPRDQYLQAEPIDQDSAQKVITAIESYRKILASKDYKRFYQECAHSSLKKKVTEAQFTTQIATVSETLGKFFDDIVEAYEKKGSNDDDFQIGAMPSSPTPGTLIVQFADRIDAEPKIRWPKAAPVRIQMADDEGSLLFYDID